MLIYPILLCLAVTQAQPFPGDHAYHSLIGASHFQETSLDRFIRNMGKLNSIQSKIMGIPEVSNDAENAWYDRAPNKPDQLPYLFEGDIILTDDQMDTILRNAEDQLWAKNHGSPRRSRRSMTSSLVRRWTNFPIPYYINTATGVSQSAVLSGVEEWEQNTCLTFQRTSTRSSANSLEFLLGNGCYSYIGKTGNGPQQVSIGNGCTSLGTVSHEIGHALGLYHEQARYDRDEYVDVITRNIQSKYVSQFTKQSRSSMVDFGVGYDYGSVMHYDQTSFSANGGRTIETKDQNYQTTIGQRIAPSFADFKRVNAAYCNSSCYLDLDCANGGYTDPKDCSKCRCPDGLGGVLCDRAASNPAGCGSGDLTATDQLQTISMTGSTSCSYVITAPAGRRVFFQLTDFAFSRTTVCASNFLEVKYKTDLTRTGARFCSSYPTNSISDSNVLVVIYKGGAGTRFALKYRFDPPTPIDTTTAVPTTTITEPTTQTTTATTTTTSAAPSTTERPRTVTTTRPTVNTFFPPTANPCSEWTKCTANCGGCGTSTRRCGRTVHTKYCNLTPCKNNYCCRPFFYSEEGKCVRPY